MRGLGGWLRVKMMEPSCELVRTLSHKTPEKSCRDSAEAIDAETGQEVADKIDLCANERIISIRVYSDGTRLVRFASVV